MNLKTSKKKKTARKKANARNWEWGNDRYLRGGEEKRFLHCDAP